MNRHYQYLIIGGGMAADAATRGIRDIDAEGAIGLVGDDSDPPYKRPWLSKDLWNGESLDQIWLKAADRGVEMHLGRKIESIELTGNRIHDDQGDTFTFDSLLIATGVRPRELVPTGKRVLAYRTLADFQRLLDLTKTGSRFAVIGGGFIGSEVAAALAMAGKEVELIFPDPVVGSRLFPPRLAEFVTNRYREENVKLHPRTMVGTVVERDDSVTLELLNLDGSESSQQIEVDAVVMGVGAEPNTELAESAGVQVNDGIVVDRYLRTRRPNVYAAGDVACFYQPLLHQYIRVEHEDNAKRMGRAAGRAMAGESQPYDHLPSFYSDMFDMGYEAVGEIDPRLDIIEDWQDPYREGVIYYGRDDRIRGALLWNVWGKVNDARALIASAQPMSAVTVSV